MEKYARQLLTTWYHLQLEFQLAIQKQKILEKEAAYYESVTEPSAKLPRTTQTDSRIQTLDQVIESSRLELIKSMDEAFAAICSRIKSFNVTINDLKIGTPLSVTNTKQTNTNDYGKIVIGPIVWEFLGIMVMGKMYESGTFADLIVQIGLAFKVCVCGVNAIVFTDSIRPYLNKHNDQTLLYILHESSKLSQMSDPRDFHNFKFGLPPSYVFDPRVHFKPEFKLNDWHLLTYVNCYDIKISNSLHLKNQGANWFDKVDKFVTATKKMHPDLLVDTPGFTHLDSYAAFVDIPAEMCFVIIIYLNMLSLFYFTNGSWSYDIVTAYVSLLESCIEPKSIAGAAFSKYKRESHVAVNPPLSIATCIQTEKLGPVLTIWLYDVTYGRTCLYEFVNGAIEYTQSKNGTRDCTADR